MLTIKSGSIPISQQTQDQLKQHAQILLEKSQQIIKQKIDKIKSQEAKIEALQRNFIQWAGQKQLNLRQKLQKSQKNKNDHLQKIVKKCKDHKKFLGQKLKLYHIKNRKTLKQAWKKAQQFNHSIQLYQNSKNISFQRSHQKINNQVNNQMSQSLYITQQSHHQKYQNQKEYLTVNYGTNANISKVYNNASKQYWNQINRSVHVFKPLQTTKKIVQQQKIAETSKNKYNQKLKDTIARFRLHSQQQQKSKIQQLGEKFELIERTRLKKLEILKKKNESPQRISEYNDEQKKNKKKVQKKNFRIHSEGIVRQKRVHDWSQLNRQKRQQNQQKFIKHSDQYLYNQKLRHQKVQIQKKIEYSTIQKKLFQERLIKH